MSVQPSKLKNLCASKGITFPAANKNTVPSTTGKMVGPEQISFVRWCDKNGRSLGSIRSRRAYAREVSGSNPGFTTGTQPMKPIGSKRSKDEGSTLEAMEILMAVARLARAGGVL